MLLFFSCKPDWGVHWHNLVFKIEVCSPLSLTKCLVSQYGYYLHHTNVMIKILREIMWAVWCDSSFINQNCERVLFHIVVLTTLNCQFLISKSLLCIRIHISVVIHAWLPVTTWHQDGGKWNVITFGQLRKFPEYRNWDTLIKNDFEHIHHTSYVNASSILIVRFS